MLVWNLASLEQDRVDGEDEGTDGQIVGWMFVYYSLALCL